MKKDIKKILFLTMIGGTFASLHAQSSRKDTIYQRQISVERDYNPTLQDANKINSTPSVYNPVVSKLNIPLATWSASGTPKMPELGLTNAGNFGTDVEHDKKIGYAGLRLGTHANIEGEAGIRAVDNEATRLDFFGTYNSSSAKPLQPDYLTDNDVKAKFSDLFLKAALKQKFNPLTLFLATSYNNQAFDYYGATYTTNASSTSIDKNQSVGIFNLNAAIQSKEETILRYKIGASYDNIGFKYGEGISSTYPKGPKIGLLQANLNFNTDFGSDKIIGLNIHTLNQSLSKDYKDQHSLTDFKFNPYLHFIGSNWQATLGVNGQITIDDKTDVLMTPNVSASWNFSEASQLYADVTGDINENTYLDILRENRYANPAVRITPSRTYYDATIGVKSGAVKGFEFDVFGGYKYTTREHLYYASTVGEWQDVNSALYAKLGQGKFGGSVKTSLIPCTDLSAKLTTYVYNVKYEDDSYTSIPKAAWNKPTYTFEMNVDVKPFDKFVVSMNYLLAGGRKYFDASTYSKESMNAINELNAKGSYQFTDMISVSASINNFLNQKYEYVPGYANYGLNMLAGVSVKF